MDDADRELLPMPAMGASAPAEGACPVTEDTVDARLIFFGLDNAGKSTVMQLLVNDCLVQQQPTLHPSSAQVVIDNVRFQAFDLAGHEIGRRLWKEYFGIAGAILFLVDAADPSRFPEGAEELQMLLAEPALKEVPIAVLGTKIDLNGAASEDEFRRALGVLPEAVAGRAVQVYMCSVIERDGAFQVGEAIQWLASNVPQSRISGPKLATLGSEPTQKDDFGDDDDMMV